MRNFSKIALLILAALALTIPAHAQVATTLAAALDSQTRTFQVASTANILPGYGLVIDNEILIVASVPSAKLLYATPRGAYGSIAVPHKAGTMVLAAPANAFVKYVPAGTCSAGTGLFFNTSILITSDSGNAGAQWLCSSVVGKIVPGFGNGSTNVSPTAAVASAAAITPSGQLFHVTGTAAINTISIPVGMDPSEGALITIVADGIFSFTSTGGNIGLTSGTVVVGKTYTFAYDPIAAKWYPSTQ